MKIYVANIRDALIGVDPANKAAYQQNTENYLKELGALDSDIRAALRAVRNAYETRTGSAPMRARPEKDKEEGALVQK